MSWKCPGKVWEISRKFPGNFPEIFRKCPGHFLECCRKFPGYFLNKSGHVQDFSGTCPENIREFTEISSKLSRKKSGHFPGDFLSISGTFPRAFHRHAPDSSRKCSGRFPETSRNLPECSRIVPRTFLGKFPEITGQQEKTLNILQPATLKKTWFV